MSWGGRRRERNNATLAREKAVSKGEETVFLLSLEARYGVFWKKRPEEARPLIRGI